MRLKSWQPATAPAVFSGKPFQQGDSRDIRIWSIRSSAVTGDETEMIPVLKRKESAVRYSNIHTHTVFSDGAHTPEENVLAAIESSMVSIGFSDHSDTPCDSSYCMKKESYPAYIKEINRLKEQYRDKIEIYCGLEKDSESSIDPGPFDYVIASVHYLIRNGFCYPIDHSKKQQCDCIADEFGGNVLDFAKAYFETVVRHAEVCRPTVIGHFDVIGKFGLMPEEDPAYHKVAVEALRETARYCRYFEVNTGAISRGVKSVPYPVFFLMEEMKTCGIRPVLGADAHHKAHLTYAFDEAVALLKKAGFDTLYRFENGDFVPFSV